MSIHFLKSLLQREVINPQEFETIEIKTIESTRDWILEKSVMSLSDTDREYLIKLSFFENDVTEEEITFILNANHKPKYLLRNLYDNHLLSYNQGNINIHDSIKEVIQNLITETYKIEIHKTLTDFYSSKILIQADGEGVLYSEILKWGYHLERLNGTEHLDEKYRFLLTLDIKEIATLGDIKNFGYPFDFETEDLSSSNKLIDSLLGKRLIKKNEVSKKLRHSPFAKFILQNIDFWQDCFISYLCLSRELPFHTGYISVFKPNYSWMHQNLFCHWEHCIELMPFPPRTKAETLAHIEFIKEKFEQGAYDDKTEENKAFLQSIIDKGVPDNTPNERDPEMDATSCPTFGHYCPGGKKQAEYCRNQLE